MTAKRKTIAIQLAGVFSLLGGSGCGPATEPANGGGTGQGAGGAAMTGGTESGGGAIGGTESGGNGNGGTAASGGAGASSGGNSTGGSQTDGGGSGDGGRDGASGGAGADGPFVLLFRDEFEEFDASRWQIMTHSWAGNLALFSSESAKVQDGRLSLTLLDAPDGTTGDGGPKSFLGAEIRSVATLTYGRVKARARLAPGSAVVSSLVTIYTPWPADNWNELDIEFLGKSPTEVQFNAMVYTGPLPAPTTPVSPTQDPTMHALGFDASADFHEYTIEWTPESARYLIDGQLAHTWTRNISLMTLPQNVLLTIWASDSPAWAGAVDDSTSGASAVYDWVELYQYQP